MLSLSLPLNLSADGLQREPSLRESIDNNLRLIITSPKYSCLADMNFGFVFNNLSFENFNENEGVVYNSNPDVGGEAELHGLYEKKISGSSKSLNTFAAELKDTISTYENRLDQVSVTMTYIRQERYIHVVIKGEIQGTKAPYTYNSKIKIWN